MHGPYSSSDEDDDVFGALGIAEADWDVDSLHAAIAADLQSSTVRVHAVDLTARECSGDAVHRDAGSTPHVEHRASAVQRLHHRTAVERAKHQRHQRQRHQHQR